MLKVAGIGAGHLGKIHLKLLEQSSNYELIGFYDTNEENGKQLEKELGYKYFSNLDELLDLVEVVDIVTPTTSHFEVAKKAIEKGIHAFIEKPITHTVEQADELIKLLKKHQVKGQVGHVERFNPAFIAAKPFIKNPVFIETHRLAEFNPRGTDVPVVLDLMIHDIDIILSVVKSPVKTLHSSGVAVISDTPDIANARLEFENGCVANITTSRISMKNMRKSRFFERDAYVAVDFLDKKTEIIRMQDGDKEDPYSMILTTAEGSKKQVLFEYPNIESNNAILDELNSFADSIQHNKPIAVSYEQARDALDIAFRVMGGFKKT